MGAVVAYNPCGWGTYKESGERCDMCELTLIRSGWISVEERLPERTGKYLVLTYDGRVDIGNLVDYYCDGDLHFDNYKITHWMLLPDVPKEYADHTIPRSKGVSEGEWIGADICAEDMYCSVCSGIAPVDCEKEAFFKSNYCPSCGAKMKGGE